ncbi:hypothetical protein [Crenothrix sp.]|uniref:hypothetical protein n=1 Tax=Crenothrix sp. TaxID=3100433 RepID=UPI00374CB05F
MARNPQRAIIVLTAGTAGRIDRDNVLYLDKPIKTDEMMDAIDWANDISHSRVRRKPYFDRVQISEFAREIAKPNKPEVPLPEIKAVDTPQSPAVLKTPADFKVNEQEKLINLDEQHKKAKYSSAITIEEPDFNDFFGVLPEINLNDIHERHLAAYDPKKYYQGYVQFAYKSAGEKTQILQLSSSVWNTLVVLPHSHEIWLDTNDDVLREKACVWLDLGTMSITPIDKEITQSMGNLEKIQDMNAFLWKLALWTSKGRYPKAIEVDRPIYLQQWPDLTRYIITPHALRIAAFLVSRGPETMINVATVLAIELRYVYIFVSAAHALGLAAQAKRQMDALIQVTLPVIPPARKGILSRIINKLRGE